MTNEDYEDDGGELWVELTRVQAMERIEQMMTRDLVAFEVEYAVDLTPVGKLETYTWFMLADNSDQTPVLLAMRDPANPLAPLRWFIHGDLMADDQT